MGRLLLVLPVLSSPTSYLILPLLHIDTIPITYGFSPVITGASGFLGAAIIRYLWATYSPTCVAYSSVFGWLGFLLLIDTKLHARLRPDVAGIVVFGVVVTAGWYLQEYDVPWDGSRNSRTQVFETLAVGGAGVVLATIVWDLVPSLTVISTNGPTVNIIAHAAGAVWELVIALAAIDGFPEKVLRVVTTRVFVSESRR